MNSNTQHRPGDILYWAFTAMVGVYVVLRAATMPWVHDECASLFWYVERGEWLPGHAHWDANNHVLSTAIGLFSYKTVGLSLLGSRIGSVLAFFLYAWAAWRIGGGIERAITRGVLLAALLLCPFLLDFFSLFRGYGLQMAFWLVALDGTLRYAERKSMRSLAQLLLGLMFANVAVLSLVPLWAAVLVAFVLFILARKPEGWKRQTTLIFLLGLVPLVLAAWLSFELKERGLLYHGTLDGFVSVSIGSLCRYVLGAESPWVAWLVMTVMAAALATGIGLKRRDLLIVTGLFWTDAALRLVMAIALGVNYPEDRAALHLVPLVILSVAFAADALRTRWRSAGWLILVLLFLPMRSIVSWMMGNDDRTLLWPEQHISRDTANALDAPGDLHLHRPVILGAYHQSFLCVPYAMRVNGLEAVVPMSEGFPGGDQDLRLADNRFMQEASIGYHEWDSWDEYPNMLQRNAPLARQRVAESALSIRDNDDEYIELLHPDTLEPGIAYAVELDATIVSEGYLDLHLVVELGEEGALAGYRDDVPFALYRPCWSGEQLHLFRTFTARNSSTRQVIYLWNAAKRPVKELNGALRLHRIAAVE